MYFNDFCLIYEVLFSVSSAGKNLERRINKAEFAKKIEVTTDEGGIRVNFWVPLGRQTELLKLFMLFTKELGLIEADYELKCNEISFKATLHQNMARLLNHGLESSVKGIVIDQIGEIRDFEVTYEYSVPIYHHEFNSTISFLAEFKF